MKDFCIVYNKANKALIKKITTKFNSDGISYLVANRDFRQEDKNELVKSLAASKVLLLVIDKNSAKDPAQINALEYILENEKPVIPFVVDKIESDLYSEYFFYSFSWVDAYEDSFEDAYEVLIDAYEDLSGENAAEKKTKKYRKSSTGASKLMENKPMVFGLAVILIAVLTYFGYQYFQDEQQSQFLVGEWNLADYQDNIRRTKQDSILFITQTIPNIKRNALLIFNDDNTFERRGFSPEPQIGQWKFDAAKSSLFLKPYGATAATDELKIKNMTKNSFVIVAEEELEDSVLTAENKYRLIKRNSVTRIKFSRRK